MRFPFPLILIAAFELSVPHGVAIAAPEEADLETPAPALRVITEGEMRGILAALEDPSPEIRIRTLGYCRPAVFRPLTFSWPAESALCREISARVAGSLSSSAPREKMLAASVMGHMGAAAEPHIPGLAALLRHPDRNAAIAAAGALADLGASAAVASRDPEIAGLLHELEGQAKSADHAAASFSARAHRLSQRGDPGPGVLTNPALPRSGEMEAAAARAAPLIARLRDPDPAVRSSALADLRPVDVYAVAPHIAEIVALLPSPDRDVREYAVRTLAALGRDSSPYAAEVSAVMRDPDPVIRKWAPQVLARLGAQAASPHAPALMALLSDPDPEVRDSAADALHSLGSSFSAPYSAELAALLQDPDRRVGRMAAVLLGEQGPASAAYATGLGSLLRDEYPGVAFSAAVALGRLGPAGVPYAFGISALIQEPDIPGSQSRRDRIARTLHLLRAASAEESPTADLLPDPRMMLEAAWRDPIEAPAMAELAYCLTGGNEDNRWLIPRLLPRPGPSRDPALPPLFIDAASWRAAVLRLTRAARLWKTDAPLTVAAMAPLAAELQSRTPSDPGSRTLIEDLLSALAEAGQGK